MDCGLGRSVCLPQDGFCNSSVMPSKARLPNFSKIGAFCSSARVGGGPRSEARRDLRLLGVLGQNDNALLIDFTLNLFRIVVNQLDALDYSAFGRCKIRAFDIERLG